MAEWGSGGPSRCLFHLCPNADWGPYDDESKVATVEGVTDATGRVTLRGVRAGDVVVHFEPTFGFSGSSESKPQERVRMDPGATVELRMQRK